MEIKVTFEGGKRVNARFPDGLSLLTDQPVEEGGDGSAPSPYMAFLAAIGTCAGYYVLDFCESRGISTKGISLIQKIIFCTEENGRRSLEKVAIKIHLPSSFPERYLTAVVKAAELCTVKKTIASPPLFELSAQINN
jgi:ribosomal protein S12 methylthiotransferase accessory factor